MIWSLTNTSRLLESHGQEFRKFAELVPEDDKEVIFMGISSREDYEKAKEKQREAVEQSAPDQMPAEEIAFWEAPAPAPLQPIVIQLQPYEYGPRPEAPAQSGFGPQGFAGVLFTMWLIYNMST